MNENQPKSLAELKQDQTKLQNALVKAEIVRATIGGSNFSRHLQTSGKIGLERAVADQRAGDIQVLIETNAIPYLNSHLDSTQEQIIELEVERPRLITLWEDFLSEGSKLDGLYRNISRHVNEGRLSQSSLDNIIQLQTEHTVRGEMPDLVKAKAVWEESKAEESSQDIKKLEEEKEEETAVAVPKIEKPIVPVEPKTEERTILPDGQDVTDILRPKEKKLVAGLRLGSEENPVSRTELTRFLYGNEVPLDIAKHTFSVHLANVRKTLDRFGWEIANRTTVNERRRGENSKYYLRPKMVEAEEEIKPLPLMKINPKTKEVQLEEWTSPKTIPGKTEWAVFIGFAESTNRGELFADPAKLLEKAQETGSKSKVAVSSSVFRLRRLLELDPSNPQIIISITNKTISEDKRSGRKHVGYRLNTQVEFVSDPEAKVITPTIPEKEEHDVTLEEIDGKISVIKEAVRRKAMPQSELDEALRIRASLADGVRTPETLKLPKMVINLISGVVQVDGRTVNFHEGLTYNTLCLIARQAKNDINGKYINEFLKAHGSKTMVSQLINRIREKIEPNHSHPIILLTVGKKEGFGVYRLNADVKFIEEERKQAKTASKAKPEVQRSEPKELTLPDGQLLKVGGFRGQLLEFIIVNGLEAPVLSDDISLNLLKNTEPKSKKKVSDSIKDLNRALLIKRNWHIVNLTTNEELLKGQKAQYRLEKIVPDIIQAKEDQPKEPVKQEKTPKIPRLEPKEIPLPDGQVVKARGLSGSTLEFFISHGQGEAILSDDIALNVLGNTDHKSRRRISGVIAKMNEHILVKRGWHIINLTPPEEYKQGKKSQYRLVKIEQVEDQIETITPEEIAPIIPDESTPPQHLPGSPSEPIYVPWVETEPEKMAEERKMLDVVVTYLISHYALYYQDIIRSLGTQIPQRRIRRKDGDYFRITSHELIKKSLDALTQMNEESKIWAITQTWSGEEKQLFAKVERLARNLSQGNVNRLKDKIRGKIISARNLYHGDQPETGWIKL